MLIASGLLCTVALGFLLGGFVQPVFGVNWLTFWHSLIVGGTLGASGGALMYGSVRILLGKTGKLKVLKRPKKKTP